MRLHILVCGLAGIACWSLGVLAAGDRLHAIDGSEATDAPAQEMAVSADRKPAMLERKPVRAVSPELFSAPFAAGDGGLERIDPREALTPPEEKRAPKVRLSRPQTLEAGRLDFAGRRLRLAGLMPTREDKTCPTVDGGSWPCGKLARTHQRLFIRNRSVACDLPDAGWDGEAVANCQVAGIDIATWLAHGGWAVAPAGSPLEALSEQARRERRGLFGEDPRGRAEPEPSDSDAVLPGVP